MSEKNYLSINRADLPDVFEVKDDKIYLKNSSAKPIKIKFPLILNEEIAKLPAMIMDGCISRNLSSCLFCQKKDNAKIYEFYNISKNYFNIVGKIYLQKPSGALVLVFSSKVFAAFLYFCLDFHKTGESARIPKWVWKSPKSVVVEYLRYAYAMEGSIRDITRGGEVKFHSCDLEYMFDLQLILQNLFDIKSRITGYWIKSYGWKFYLNFERKSEIRKFYEQIGFALDSHQIRLNEVVNNIHPKAWEITIVKIASLSQPFSLAQASALFSYIKSTAVLMRLKELIRLGYLTKINSLYSLTSFGIDKSNSLRSKIKIMQLKSNSIENENTVFNFIQSQGNSYAEEIARKVKINYRTVRGVLARLVKAKKIKFTNYDKFQRKFYECIKCEAPVSMGP